jgi:ankyrin repeat protein
MLKDKPINRISVQEKFPLLDSSQLSTLLLYLARVGDADSVKYLCRTAMVNVNISDDSGRSPLVYAAIGGHTETMKILLKSGAFVDAIDHGGRTALFHSAYYSLPDSIKVLLKYGADITHRDFYGKTVLHYSVFSDRVESTKILLGTLRSFKFQSFFGAQKWESLIESFDESGVTPMMLAAYLGQLGHLKEMVFMNYKSTKLKNKDGYSCIHFCANNSHLHVSKYLIKKDHHIIYEAVNSGCKPIHLAARKGNYAFLELLLKTDRNLVNVLDLQNRTPLHYASGINSLTNTSKWTCRSHSNSGRIRSRCRL